MICFKAASALLCELVMAVVDIGAVLCHVEIFFWGFDLYTTEYVVPVTRYELMTSNFFHCSFPLCQLHPCYLGVLYTHLIQRLRCHHWCEVSKIALLNKIF